MAILKRLAFPRQRGTEPLEVLLMQVEGGHPYATYLRNMTDGGKFWGHYFADVLDAEVDYEVRGQKMFEEVRGQGLVLNESLIGYRAAPRFAESAVLV